MRRKHFFVKTVYGRDHGPRHLGPPYTGESLNHIDVITVDPDDVLHEGVVTVLLAGPGGDIAGGGANLIQRKTSEKETFFCKNCLER